MIDPRFYDCPPALSLHQIAQLTGAALDQSQNITGLSIVIESLAPLDEADDKQLACFHNSKYITQLQQSKAAACLMRAQDVNLAPPHMVPLITAHPYRAFGLLAQEMYPSVDRHYESMLTAVHPQTEIEDDCIIEYGCVIHKGAKIGSGTRLGANTVIGPGVVIGQNCVIESNVTIKYSVIGNNVTILAGTCIGQAGFGFFMDEKGHVKVPQLGRVVVADNVEIGSNVTIDRGSMKDTIIGTGCRIDNLVQIAHNVTLGRGCVIVAQVGIAGSTHIGDHVIMAGQAGVAGHLKIGNRVRVAAQSGIMRNIDDDAAVAGYPAVPVKQWHRQTIAVQNLIKPNKNKV